MLNMSDYALVKRLPALYLYCTCLYYCLIFFVYTLQYPFLVTCILHYVLHDDIDCLSKMVSDCQFLYIATYVNLFHTIGIWTSHYDFNNVVCTAEYVHVLNNCLNCHCQWFFPCQVEWYISLPSTFLFIIYIFMYNLTQAARVIIYNMLWIILSKWQRYQYPLLQYENTNMPILL